MIKRIAIFWIAVLLVSCSTVSATPTQSFAPQAIKNTPTVDPTVEPTETLLPKPTPTNEPNIDVYNFLLLGGDYRSHRRGTGYGDKTDVMLLVSFKMSDPIKITIVQFPRNLYHPVESFDDMWLFHVYGREGFPGLHYYFQQVFDVDLHGIAYINMDNFVTFVDELGGVYLNQNGALRTLGGDAALDWLRDNDNNWGCSSYDCEGRHFRVLKALAHKIKTQFHENAWVTTTTLWDAYGSLFETDLSDLEQLHWLVELGWHIASSEYDIIFEKLTESETIEYGETPLEVRGWVASGDLPAWFKGVLYDN